MSGRLSMGWLGHLDPPYARTGSHDAIVCFYCDVVLGNPPLSVRFDCDWLVTENLIILPH
jgi:hypothetical protein